MYSWPIHLSSASCIHSSLSELMMSVIQQWHYICLAPGVNQYAVSSLVNPDVWPRGIDQQYFLSAGHEREMVSCSSAAQLRTLYIFLTFPYSHLLPYPPSLPPSFLSSSLPPSFLSSSLPPSFPPPSLLPFLLPPSFLSSSLPPSFPPPSLLSFLPSSLQISFMVTAFLWSFIPSFFSSFFFPSCPFFSSFLLSSFPSFFPSFLPPFPPSFLWSFLPTWLYPLFLPSIPAPLPLFFLLCSAPFSLPLLGFLCPCFQVNFRIELQFYINQGFRACGWISILSKASYSHNFSPFHPLLIP